MNLSFVENLQQALYEHGLLAIARIRSLRPTDSFYSFAFYTSGSFGYAFLTASSYEGLDEAVETHSQNPNWHKHNIIELRKSLKWSPCDSPLHAIYDEHCDLDVVMNQVQDAFCDCNDDEVFEFVNGVKGAFLGAMRQLDAEGKFASNLERQNIVLNILQGDQSDEDRIRFASHLNPPDVVNRFITELADINYD